MINSRITTTTVILPTLSWRHFHNNALAKRRHDGDDAG
jgi:hypothetical protein